MKSDFERLKLQAAGLRAVCLSSGRGADAAIVGDLLNALEGTQTVLAALEGAAVDVRFPQYTRVTVVAPDGGLAYENRNYRGLELHDQDGGRTLKIFPLSSNDNKEKN